MDPSNDPTMQVHEYDGIQELDNKLPGWWVLLFYITTIFGILHFCYYHVIDKGQLPAEKYEAAIAAHDERQAELAAAEALANPESVVIMTEPSTDAAIIATGKAIFDQHCFACHLKTGGGMVGPNLTDDHWIHGASFAENVHTVTVGVPEKGMISWKPVLKKAEIEAVCSYMYTLRGTKPAPGKAPEGTQIQGSDSPDYRPPAS